MTTTDRDVADHHAAGSLADELPYWGWLPDERTCLTRRGELVTLARLTPTVVDGRTPEQLDAVLNRWTRMLSGIDSRTRLYFYLLRRPSPTSGNGSDARSLPLASNRSTPLSRGATTQNSRRPPPARTTHRGGSTTCRRG